MQIILVIIIWISIIKKWYTVIPTIIKIYVKSKTIENEKFVFI